MHIPVAPDRIDLDTGDEFYIICGGTQFDSLRQARYTVVIGDSYGAQAYLGSMRDDLTDSPIAIRMLRMQMQIYVHEYLMRNMSTARPLCASALITTPHAADGPPAISNREGSCWTMRLKTPD